MKRLDLFILKRFIGPFVLTFVVVVFILLVQYMLKYFEDFVGKNLGAAVFVELLFYFSLNMMPVALPLAILLSSLMTYGNLGQHNELAAIKSAGISLVRIILPIGIFVLMLTVGVFYFNDIIVPKANLRAYSLLYDIRQKKPSLDIKQGAFYYGLPGYTVKVNQKLPDGKSLKGIIIYDHQDGRGNSKITLADSGTMKTIHDNRYLVLDLFRGSNFSEVLESDPRHQEFVRSSFAHTNVIFSLSSFDLNRTDVELFSSNRMMRNLPQLHHDLDSLSQSLREANTSAKTSITSLYGYLPKKPTAPIVIARGKGLASIHEMGASQQQGRELSDLALNQARNVRAFTKALAEREEALIHDLNVFEVEVWRKYTQALACFVLFLIGAPLGAIIKKGGLGVPIIISILFFVIYYVISITTEKWSKEGIVQVWFGMSIGNLVLTLVGLFLLRQARRDASLFEIDYYTQLVKRLTRGIFGTSPA